MSPSSSTSPLPPPSSLALIVYESTYFLYVRRTWSVTLREEHRLRVLRGIFELKRVGVTESRNCIMRSFIM
jgi:hypothetical protein